MKALITINNCRIENTRETLIQQIDWQMKQGEAWLVIGPNGGGKADFINALAGKLKVVPNAQIKLVDNIIQSSSSKTNVSDNVLTDSSQAFFSSVFGDSVELVSLERAAHLIQEERENDESEYVEGGVDIGRTGRIFIAEALCNKNDGDAKAYSSNNSIKKKSFAAAGRCSTSGRKA